MMASKPEDMANGADVDVVDHCATSFRPQKPVAKPRTLLSVPEDVANPAPLVANNNQLHNSSSSKTNGHNINNNSIPVQQQQQQRRKSSFPGLEKLPLFQQFRKRGASAPAIHSITPSVATSGNGNGKPAFVKSSSLARLFGSTYSPDNHNNTSASAASAAATKGSAATPPQQTGSSTIVERFHACADDDIDAQLLAALEATAQLEAAEADGQQLGARYSADFDAAAANPFRSLSRGLGRLFFKKSYSVKISEPDPEFKVAYLGNVLTGWAKGESCMEKPLATLWRNYTAHSKPDVTMRVRICPSGLKATTRQHGLTEYWSHRVTFCSAPRQYPKVFCWIYRHEGRKLKHELRCHAVLCSKPEVAENIAQMLQDNLCRALREFKRDKVNKQNARLSLVNSVYENPSMPQRKIMLSVGGNNYRPPLERSKSAPRLMVIEEQGEEPDELSDAADEAAEAASAQRHRARPACCTVDPLYPAMTLGRRKCRRGHSIRRTGTRTLSGAVALATMATVGKRCAASESPRVLRFNDVVQEAVVAASYSAEARPTTNTTTTAAGADEPNDRLRDSGSGDDLDKLLLGSNYNSASPLANELLSYFDAKFKTNTSPFGTAGESGGGGGCGSMIELPDASGSEDEEDYRTVTFRRRNSSRRFAPIGGRQSLSVDNLDAYCQATAEADAVTDDDLHAHADSDDEDEPLNPAHRHARFFDQTEILSKLSRMSGHAHQDSGYAADNGATELLLEEAEAEAAVATTGQTMRRDRLQQHTAPSSLDSDEGGSISSGFETVSTVTANGADGGGGESATNSLEECSGASSVRTTPLAVCKQQQMQQQQPRNGGLHQLQQQRRHLRRTGSSCSEDSAEERGDSDVSDESGYVEYQRRASAAAARAATGSSSSQSTVAIANYH